MTAPLQLTLGAFGQSASALNECISNQTKNANLTLQNNIENIDMEWGSGTFDKTTGRFDQSKADPNQGWVKMQADSEMNTILDEAEALLAQGWSQIAGGIVQAVGCAASVYSMAKAENAALSKESEADGLEKDTDAQISVSLQKDSAPNENDQAQVNVSGNKEEAPEAQPLANKPEEDENAEVQGQGVRSADQKQSAAAADKKTDEEIQDLKSQAKKLRKAAQKLREDGSQKANTYTNLGRAVSDIAQGIGNTLAAGCKMDEAKAKALASLLNALLQLCNTLGQQYQTQIQGYDAARNSNVEAFVAVSRATASPA